MDEIDKKIIMLLKDNARMSLSVIAKQVGRSRTVISSRIEKLESDGEIIKFTVQLRQKKISALFEIKLNPGNTCYDVVIPYKKLNSVVKAWSVAGHSDLFMMLEFDETNALNHAHTVLLSMEAVLSVQTHVITNIFY